MPLIEIPGDDRGPGVGALLEKVISTHPSEHKQNMSSDSGSLINHKSQTGQMKLNPHLDRI